jgi:hypothetical protein
MMEQRETSADVGWRAEYRPRLIRWRLYPSVGLALQGRGKHASMLGFLAHSCYSESVLSG